jgi:hypothetical protein
MRKPSSNADDLRKHRLATELEAQKWAYKRQELEYLEAGQHLRALNQLMWQVPSMSIAITGGLWFGATTVDSEQARIWVFAFVAIVDVLVMMVLWRLRHLIDKHIDLQREFSGLGKSGGPWKKLVIKCWIGALAVAAIVSTVGAFHPEALNKDKAPEKTASCCNVTLDIPPQQCPVQPVRPVLPKKRPCTP